MAEYHLFWGASICYTFFMIQIIGTKKCKITRKAERFFKERRIPFQFRDIQEKGLAPRELSHIAQVRSWDEMLDTQNRAYQDRGMAYMEFSVSEELEADQGLIKTPLVRTKTMVAIGDEPEVWKQIALAQS